MLLKGFSGSLASPLLYQTHGQQSMAGFDDQRLPKIDEMQALGYNDQRQTNKGSWTAEIP